MSVEQQAMAVKVFFIETQDVVAEDALCFLSEQVPQVEFRAFDHIVEALQPEPYYDRVVICVPHRLLNGGEAVVLQQLLARQPHALLVTIRSAADLPSLCSLLEMLAPSRGERQAGAVWARPVVAAEAAVPPRLSERELEILLLLREGLQNKLIARRLDLSVSTVKTHVANIFRKIGAGNRLDAICKFAALSRPAADDPLLSFRRNLLAGRSAALFAHEAA
jgi:DNA-binding CsgD family transcriptional regulator